MKEGIDKKMLEAFFQASLDDHADAKIKQDLEKDSRRLQYPQMQALREVQLADKERFFEHLDKPYKKIGLPIKYVIGIAASILVIIALSLLRTKPNQANIFATWDSLDTIEKLKTLNFYNNDKHAHYSNFLLTQYEKEENLNVKLKMIDCLKKSDITSANFQQLFSNESAPLAQLSLAGWARANGIDIN